VKRLFISVLVAAMVLGFGSTAFGAAGSIAPAAFSDIAGHKAEAELTLMAALGIFTGETGLGGTVKPDDPITRAQFCKVVVLAAGRGSTALGLAGLRPTFKDEIPAWAWGYVNVASYMGIIGGYPDGTFKAANPLTYAEAVTMLVRAVRGHQAQVGAGVWPYNYLFYAVDNDFTGAVDVGFANLPCSRGDMARLLFATMQVDPLDTKGLADEDGAILEEGTNLFTGILNDFGDTWMAMNWDGGGAEFDLGDPVYLAGAKSLADLYFTSIIAVTKSNAVIFVQKTEGRTTSGIFAHIYTDGLGDSFLELADGARVPFVDDVAVILNGADGRCAHDLTAGDELVINLDGQGNAVGATALRWDLVWTYVEGNLTPGAEDIIVGEVEKSTNGSPTTKIYLGDGSFYFTCDCTISGSYMEIGRTVPVTINGKAAKADDLARYDVIRGATFGADGGHGSDIIRVAAIRGLAKGVVTGTATSYPGPRYSATLKADGASRTYALNPAYCGLPSPNQLRQYALNAAGELFYPIDFTSASPIVYVTGASTETAGGTTRYFLIADVRGVSQTFESDFDSAGLVGSFGELSVDGATGKVTGWSGISFSGTDWEVVAIGSDSVTMFDGGNYQFVSKPLVYRQVGSAYTFLGLGGLAVGDHVYASGGLSILIHDDTP
jgi:hypothetical protein